MNFFSKPSWIALVFLSTATFMQPTSRAETWQCPYNFHDSARRSIDCLNYFEGIRSIDRFNDLYAEGRYIDPDTKVEIIWQITPNSFNKFWYKSSQNMRAGNLSPSEVKRHLEVVKQVLAKYPSDLIKQSIKQIYLVTNLEVKNSKFDGFYIGQQGAIYLNNLGANNRHDDLYLAGVLHHEISSFLFYRYATPEFIAKWQEHNPKNFQYAGGNGIDYYRQAIDRGLNTNEIREDCLQEGFLNIYARSNLENDFNEIAERMFSDREHLWQLASKHQKLQNKLELFIEFYISINPQFKTQFVKN
jgi:hypothetical protein